VSGGEQRRSHVNKKTKAGKKGLMITIALAANLRGALAPSGAARHCAAFA
jgi:hypothetical protein